ncbi:hypothetical protein HS088_TW03G00685 [Tripterygium wilfordii]|uniref:Protein PHYTOCHROME KINASE SUBSTRATE 4 n=1 Tax=Tripterygium wilfordii TaxID=458696 RepID=A0A7J7DVM3_TRIWF|nr:protein PHYTOCHROME KINASE SUBSTRATE 4-like [Tripterygium wilfordii]KAF5750349.1 hypothetical protein HS088_TW03G00685 [Tripterygium wilfordii]
MERSTTVVTKTLNGRKPILAPMEPGFLPYITFPQKTNIRDASFSSYLQTEEPNQAVDDSEISIFDAQEYFNENNVNDPKPTKKVSPINGVNLKRSPEVPRLSSAPSSVDGYRNYRVRSFNATPTASSEASWNSQTGLLSNPPGAIAVSIRNPPSTDKKTGSSAKWIFRRKCPCSGKKSVQVEEHINPSEPKITIPRLKETCTSKPRTDSPIENSALRILGAPRREDIPSVRRISAENHFASNLTKHERILPSGRAFNDGGSGFTFPILSHQKLVLNGSDTPPLDQDPPRESLEVFRPKDELVSTTVSGIITRRSFTFPTSPKSRMVPTDDDMASDASSDLFEIESFSTQTTSYPTCTRRDSLEDASTFNLRSRFLQLHRSLDEPMTPSLAPTECYEPSEVSIDWSVTTAEGFDKASVTNFSVTASEAEEMTWRERNSGGGGKKKAGGLLSCRCEKAVNVGPHPVKCGPNEGQRVGPSGTERHVTVSSRAHRVNKPPLASSRPSIPFAT